MTCQSKSNSRFFSLFEITIVLVIIGIIVGLTAPKIGLVGAGIQRAGFLKTLNSAFHLASSIAASTGRPSKLRIDFGSRQIHVDHPGQSASSRVSPDNFGNAPRNQESIFEGLRKFPLPEDTEPTDAYAYNEFEGPPEYVFYPNGEAAGPTISMNIGERLRLVVDIDRLTGRPLIKTYGE